MSRFAVTAGRADLNVALQSAAQRPELRGLEAGIQEAEPSCVRPEFLEA